MTSWNLPTGFLRIHSWKQPDGRKQLQRSVWTGRTRELVNGPSDRWTCSGEIRQMNDAKLIIWRAFQMRMKQPGARVRLPATIGSQHAVGSGLPDTCTVGAALAFGQTVVLTGLTPSAVNLPAGALLTIALPSGDEQMLGLLADLLADEVGNAIAQLDCPLRESPALGAAVQLAEPYALMRAIDPKAWASEPGRIHSVPAIEFEEAF